MPFDGIADILRMARSKFPQLSKRLDEAKALDRWEVAVGAIIAKHSRAIRVKDGVLFVEVDHPIWRSELHHRKHQIMTILNDQSKDPTKPGSEKFEALTDVVFFEARRR